MTTRATAPHELAYEDDEDEGIALGELLAVLWAHAKLVVGGGLLAGLLGLGVAFLMPPIFTARTVFLPPQQQQSSAAAALNSLGALAGLAGGAGGIKTPADQYVAFMQSVTVLDKLIDAYQLMDVYEAKYRADARKALTQNTVMLVGKKDGLITIDVDDKDPKRAADIANAYVEGLRGLTTTLAVSEAQQRRLFFEQQLQQTKARLTEAQIGLQASGYNAGAIKAEPKAAAESYARLQAEATAAEVRLQALRKRLAEGTPELEQQQATLSALRGELARLARRDDPTLTAQGGADYITKYREFKYQETLFELFARQYELARADESREGALIQVLDAATPPERKSKPKRAFIALGSGVLAGLLLCAFVLFRHFRAASRAALPAAA